MTPAASLPRIFSGMQPTGELHIGNYLGALRNWVTLAQSGQFDPVFCVVDAHALTIEYDRSQMPGRIFDTALTYLAAGLDPERCTLFVQSDVTEHMELAWYLSTVTPMGDLHRMTQFKEKSDEHKNNINAGLFTYPVLMAADVLLYRANVVPVGNDQVQHLELARELCRKFNARYGELFPEPKPRLSQTPRIMGVDGRTKMSKSRGNAIGLFEPAKSVEKKIKGAFTDPDKLRLGDPGNPGICNVFTIHQAITSEDEVARIDQDCRSGKLPCGECKRALCVNLLTELGPIRARAEELRADPKRVLKVLEDGAEKARCLARETMVPVRDAMGIGARLPKGS
jgi:tryptophanyl-tRNA synthetase